MGGWLFCISESALLSHNVDSVVHGGKAGMRKSRLKGILAAVSAIALFVQGIIAVNMLERISEKAPEGEGTRAAG